MYFVLCQGAEASIDRWSDLVRKQAEVLRIKQSDVSIIASSSWHKQSIGRQLMEQLPKQSNQQVGMLILSPDPWRSVVSSAPKPIKMDSGRVRFSFSMDTGDQVIGIKVEMARPSPRQVLECLNWLRREVEVYAND